MTCRLGGVEFSRVVLDIVARSAEIDGSVERLVIPPVVPALPYGPIEFATVDVAQHAAEKFHAMSRRYSGDRPSSRVKDLADLVLMLDAGLLPDTRLAGALRRTYHSRDGIEPPEDLVPPPFAWTSTYPRLADDLDLSARDLTTAYTAVRALYSDAVRTDQHSGVAKTQTDERALTSDGSADT